MTLQFDKFGDRVASCVNSNFGFGTTIIKVHLVHRFSLKVDLRLRFGVSSLKSK